MKRPTRAPIRRGMRLGTEGHGGAKGVEAADGGLGPHQVWTFDVDGVTYQHDEPRITGGEIMALAGVRPSQILLQYFEDGFDETIDPDDVVRALATAKRRTGRRLGSRLWWLTRLRRSCVPTSR